MKFFLIKLSVLLLLLSCSKSLHPSKNEDSLIRLINATHKKKRGIMDKDFQGFDRRVYEVREKAVEVFGVETDTSKIDKFIVINWISFAGGSATYGEMIINDSVKYFYKAPYLSKEIQRLSEPVYKHKTVLKYLNAHDFKKLEAEADANGKQISGSHFLYIGMYEKGMDSIYVALIPMFPDNN